MRFWMTMYVLLCCPIWSLGQLERVYNDEGYLTEVNPINDKGEYHGVGFTYYPSGAVWRETPYKQGSIEGTQKVFYETGALQALIPYKKGKKSGQETNFYPDSAVQSRREWRDNRLSGWSQRFYPNGELYIYSLLKQDSILFTQRFDSTGRLSREIVGTWQQPLDTIHLLKTRVFLAHGDSLNAGEENPLQLMVPGIPLALARYSARGGQVERDLLDRLPYFLTIVPDPGVTQVELYVRLSLRPGAAPSLVRQVVIPVASSPQN